MKFKTTNEFCLTNRRGGSKRIFADRLELGREFLYIGKISQTPCILKKIIIFGQFSKNFTR